MEKTDLTKTDKPYYSASAQPELASFPELHYLSITGKGDPSAPEFENSISTLYREAYRIKFAYKMQGMDFVVPKLEGLWWYDEDKYASVSMEETTQLIPRSEWSYRLLIRLPEFVDLRSLMIKEPLALYRHHEEMCIQMLHIGPYDSEPQSLLLLKQFSDRNDFVKAGIHHEIYLSDFRKTPPEKLKTILREPVKQRP